MSDPLRQTLQALVATTVASWVLIAALLVPHGHPLAIWVEMLAEPVMEALSVIATTVWDDMIAAVVIWTAICVVVWLTLEALYRLQARWSSTPRPA